MAKKTQDWSNSWFPQFLDVYKPLFKEEGMLHSGKHGPVPTFLRAAAAIKFKMGKYFS